MTYIKLDDGCIRDRILDLLNSAKGSTIRGRMIAAELFQEVPAREALARYANDLGRGRQKAFDGDEQRQIIAGQYQMVYTRLGDLAREGLIARRNNTQGCIDADWGLGTDAERVAAQAKNRARQGKGGKKPMTSIKKSGACNRKKRLAEEREGRKSR